MGAKTWMLVHSSGNAAKALAAGHPLDRDASARLAASLFPSERLELLPDGDLSCTNPPDDEVFVGCFPGVAVIAAAEFGMDNPSRLPKHFLATAPYELTCFHAMHSSVDWFAFAVWHGSQLKRSLSLSPDSGIIGLLPVLLTPT